jgi:spermidine synthase
MSVKLKEIAGWDFVTRPARLLSILFFFSGFPALIYQLVWQRALFRIFGVNMESVTIVVAAFMLGLGLGSLAGGWLSKVRYLPLLVLLAGIELSTAAFGAVSLSLFDRIGALAAFLSLAGMAAVALALVIVPTLLMGTTLPLLVGYLAQRSGTVGGSLGRLYCANTFGAGVVCLLAALLLFPFSGMESAIYVAIAINVAVAAGALAAQFAGNGPAAPMVRSGPSEPITTAGTRLSFVVVCALAFLGGFVSLSYEIYFVHLINYATGGMAPAFAVTLGVFLLGVAAGSDAAGRVC